MLDRGIIDSWKLYGVHKVQAIVMNNIYRNNTCRSDHHRHSSLSERLRRHTSDMQSLLTEFNYSLRASNPV